LFSGLSRSSTVPAGSAAKASSVGAKTVKGPSPFSVSTSPAASTAATSVPKLPAPTAVSTISIVSACALSAKPEAMATVLSIMKLLRIILISLGCAFRRLAVRETWAPRAARPAVPRQDLVLTWKAAALSPARRGIPLKKM
jgi:hypothetical protein